MYEINDYACATMVTILMVLGKYTWDLEAHFTRVTQHLEMKVECTFALTKFIVM